MTATTLNNLKKNYFVRGVVRIVDLSCTRSSSYRSAQQRKPDWENIAQDWKKVGDDIATSIEKYKKDAK